MPFLTLHAQDCWYSPSLLGSSVQVAGIQKSGRGAKNKIPFLKHLAAGVIRMKKLSADIKKNHTPLITFGMIQSSCLSQISQIIFVEKKLSCGEILGNFEKF